MRFMERYVKQQVEYCSLSFAEGNEENDKNFPFIL